MLATLKKTFKASAYQQAIFDHITTSKGSMIVEAVAGSGKSTTIKQAVLRIVRAQPYRLSIQVFAFNSIIAKEMREAIAELAQVENVDLSGVRVSTFHSVGFSAICRRLNKKPRDVETDSNKMRNVLRKMFVDDAAAKYSHKEQAVIVADLHFEMYGSFCAKLVGLAKGQGFGALRPADADDWLDLIAHHDLFLDDEAATEAAAVEFARRALKISNDLGRLAVIDFDDQLYLPLLWKLKLWENDWVFVDEAQDTNEVRRAITAKALKSGGRLCAVGDRRQAIYGFTGASHDAMDLIKREFNCTELPLSVSYRCGRKIVEYAQRLVPHLEAAPGAVDGAVTYPTLKDALGRLTATDAIMCRNTAPLIELAFKLVAEGRGCRVLGKEIGDNLIGLVKRQNAKGVSNLQDKLRVYKAREMKKHLDANNEARAEAIADRVACVQTIIENLPEKGRTVPALLAKIASLFADQGAGLLTLATMHKLKGTEFDRVALYHPELCPSKFARQEWQVLQEDNLLYVGYTRAKLELMILQEG